MPSMGVVGSRLKKLVSSFDVLNFDLSLQRPAVVPSFDLKGVAGVLRSASNVVVMTGAGISTATGLPDFRSRGSGLYASESASGLGVERPEDAFSIAHFEANPEAFYTLARDLWPSSDILPTATHHFLALLEAKGKLRRAYTQNVDSLELIAGLSPENVVQVHGHFRSACCVTNGLSVPIEELHAAVLSGSETCASLVAKYGGPVKPDLIFFGEPLPPRALARASDDFAACDLLLIIGTTLCVEPFAELCTRVGVDVPRLVINRERVEYRAPQSSEAQMLGFDDTSLHFDEGNHRNIEWLGDCDDGVQQLAALMGWQQELHQRCYRGDRPGT